MTVAFAGGMAGVGGCRDLFHEAYWWSEIEIYQNNITAYSCPTRLTPARQRHLRW